MRSNAGHGLNMGKLALRVFLALVAVNAAIGIVVLMAGGLGPTGGRILLTSLSLTAGVMLGLACSTGARTPPVAPMWPAGVVSAAAGFALLIAGIWTEPGSSTFWKVPGTLIAVSVAVALVSLARLATLPRRFRWTFFAVEALTAVLLVMLLIGIWGEIDSSWFGRIFGAAAVALAAFVLVIPVLSRVGAREARSISGATAVRVSFCPNCGCPIVPASGVETRCLRCGATFEVRFGERSPEPDGPRPV